MSENDTAAPNDQANLSPSEEGSQMPLSQNLGILVKSSRAFWVINLITFLDGVAYFGILNLLTLFIGDYVGFSDESKTLAVSLFTGAVTLFMFGGGFVADKLGVRKALTFSVFLLLVGRIFLVNSPLPGGVTGAAVLWVGLFFMAFGCGVLDPAKYAGVKEFSDPRTNTLGYSLLYSIMNLGIIVGSAISPFIRQAFGITGVFWVLTGVTAVMLLAQLFLFTLKVERSDRVIDPEKEKEKEKQAEQDVQKSTWQKIRELPFLDVRFIFFIFVLLPVRTLFAHQFLTIPDYVMRCFPSAIGARYEWFQGINPIIIVIFVPLFGAFTRKATVLKMMIIGTTVSALTTFILVPGPHLYTLLGYVVVFSLGEALWSSRFLEYVADLAPAGKVGAYMGLAGIPWFLAKSTTGIYAGHMIARFIPAWHPPELPSDQSGTMWLIYGFIACISPIGLIMASKWISKGVPEKK